MTTLLNKPVTIVASAGFNEQYGGLEASLYVKTAMAVLQKFPYDMLVFEMPDKSHYQVRLAGYHLINQTLDEKTVVFQTKSLEIKKFWCKVDDLGNEYAISFLFPEEY